MKKQVYNPYLPLNEYVPDGEPHVFGDRVYIYGSHDLENGDGYCLLDYVCYSAPMSDLSDWRYEGEIYKRAQDPHDTKEQYLYAPDICQGPDGRYYLYYVLSNEFEFSVAVCDTPCGQFEYYGRVAYKDGTVLQEILPFDPAILNDDGKIFLYYGFAPSFPIHRFIGQEMLGAVIVELAEDMLTVRTKPKVVLPSKKYAVGSGFEGHAFFEACSIRKIKDTYYLIYASENSHELCYAYSRYPDRDFNFGGTVISNADVGYKGRRMDQALNCISNNHGGLVEVNGQWYVFYHRHTHGHQFSRQGCAEPVTICEDGRIMQAEITSCGLNGDALTGRGEYPAAIACNLHGEKRGVTIPYVGRLEDQPYITNEGELRFITHFTKGCVAGFKYFRFDDVKKIALSVRGDAGMMIVRDDEDILARIEVMETGAFKTFTGALHVANGIKPIFLQYEGDGNVDILSLSFEG